MKYYGIKTPKTEYDDSYIWWITNSSHKSWAAFFSYPDRLSNYNHSRPPMTTAREAYEAIGYKCVELEIKEKAEENNE